MKPRERLVPKERAGSYILDSEPTGPTPVPGYDRTAFTHLFVPALHHERRVQLEGEVEGLRFLEEAVMQHDDLVGEGQSVRAHGCRSDEKRQGPAYVTVL